MIVIKKIKGLTFLETIVSLTIILLVSSFLFLKITKINEKLDIEKNRRLIQTTFLKYTSKSFYEKKRYLIEINFLENNLIITQNKLPVEKIILSNKLKYEIPYEKKRNPKFNVETTKTGNLSKSFTMYIFGYKNQVKNRIAFYIFKKEKILKINTYLNNSLKDVNYNNILEYHYSIEGENRTGWKEENYN
ncbi:MAG: hypothetical protein ACRC5T_04855 [Cetobacterium sp.]